MIRSRFLKAIPSIGVTGKPRLLAQRAQLSSRSLVLSFPQSSLYSKLSAQHPLRLQHVQKGRLAGGAIRSYSLWPFGRLSAPSPPESQTTLVEQTPPPPPVVEPTLPVPEPLTEALISPITSASEELAALELEHGFLARYTSGLIEQGLCVLHDQLALPWFLTIPVVILLLRTLLIPVNIWSMRIGAANLRVKPTLDKKIAAIKELQTRGEQHKALSAQQELRSFMKQEGFRPLAPLGLPLMQGSLFVSFFWALRELGTHQLPSLTAEGALWFMDLTTAGPWYGLPLMASGLTLLSVETAAEMGGLTAGQSTKVMWFLRSVIVGTLWLFHDLPSAVFLYWCTNNLFSLMWGTFVRLAPQSLKLKLKIPDTKALANQSKTAETPSFLDGFRAAVSSDTNVQQSPKSTEKIKPPEPIVWQDKSRKKQSKTPVNVWRKNK
ncbi:hypothetical protein O181_017572 [Austropuccinia psidii MF-1]|uniref:Membrane insertase YidC/Oxa/ALB C-terminal domain-containing protein n=1 Tax=Austropuccinia psidii MF-1 TaxID=1389203 RepID=A0A9Q3C7V0_9BASI|nr:hypothetical protein [Austropuccinia psidii MF-1]